MMFRSGVKTSFLLLAAFFISIPPAWAQQPDGKSSENSGGAITGRVVNSAGEPLAGASVSAGSIFSNGRRKSVTVESNGEFKISGLEPGLYSISATMPGYVFTTLPA